jgi:DNA-binding CsgD family transcriptional regulator
VSFWRRILQPARPVRPQPVLSAEQSAGLIQDGLEHSQWVAWVLQTWQTLSPREQEVVALASQTPSNGPLTNRQIAQRLGIAENTVKVHLRGAQLKFNVRSKAGLRLLFQGWDFGEEWLLEENQPS